MACLAAKPIVNGIERDLADTATVVRLDLSSEEGRQIARRYDVRAIPTILAFKDGQVVQQLTGARPKAAFDDMIQKLLS